MTSWTSTISNSKQRFGKLFRAIISETNKFLPFLLGLLFGLVVSYLIHSSEYDRTLERATTIYEKASSLVQQLHSEKINSTTMPDYETNTPDDTTAENEDHESDIPLADQLYNSTRVLCWIMTIPANHKKKAIHIKNTWGRRCNKLLFMSSREDPELGAIKITSTIGRNYLWIKVRESFKYIYENHLDDADWFMKADDDTFVFMENLRSFLYSFSTEAPVYFGAKYRQLVKQGYMAGGPGYVLSKEALRRFVEKAYPDKEICPQKSPSEDWTIGKCLQNVGVAAGDTRDSEFRSRFLPLYLRTHLIMSAPKIPNKYWFWKYVFYPIGQKFNCCSNHLISFHHVPPDRFYVIEFLVYHLNIFGLPRQIDVLPPRYDTEQLVQKWREEKSNFTGNILIL